MITLEAYRLSIGCFSPRVRFPTSFIKRAYRNYYEDILLMSRFSSVCNILKRVNIRLKTIFFFAAIILLCGDVETNPGPFTILKTVQGSFHQGDPRL